MLKASAGGGGKGMRLVASEAELESGLSQARAEALAAFSDDAVYIEKEIVRPRHIEVQALADEHGACIHLGERECSLQRRHQKVVEETPAPLLDGFPEVRERITAAAVRAALAAGYSNAGTVEFLMDAERNFYFLEMNTRLQVEHPVTEMVTGLDLVKQQIRIAAGEPLGLEQKDIVFRGAAMECRVYAEDPANNFFPSPGQIVALEQPLGPNVRVDSGSYAGWTVPIEYDPLIAKLCAWAPTRQEAIAKLSGALEEYHIGGIQTTLGFFRELMRDERFLAGEIDTGFIDRFVAVERPAATGHAEVALGVAAERFAEARNGSAPRHARPGGQWRRLARESALR
jgi:acetyl-CoA carboxylase biotin carboxylase subunit